MPSQPNDIPIIRKTTPVVLDELLIEQTDSNKALYDRQLEYGHYHPDRNKYPTYRFLKSEPTGYGQTRYYWANDFSAQDVYNGSKSYAFEGNTYPTFERTYRVLRSTYLANGPSAKLQPFTGIICVKVTAGGSGYTDDFAVTFTGGSGTGAAGIALVDRAAGAVIFVAITAVGTGYTAAPTVGFGAGVGSGAAATAFIQPTTALLTKEEHGRLPDDDPYSSLYDSVKMTWDTLPGPILTSRQVLPNERGMTAVTTKQFVAHGTVTAGVTGAGVIGLSIIAGGSGFTAGTYTGGSSGGGGGGFTWTYTVASFTAGALANPVVTNAGAGYTSVPTVSITSGGGGGGDVRAKLTGTSIASALLTSTQSTFQTTPVVTVTDNGTGVGGIIEAVLTGTGIDSVVIGVGGSGYGSATITFSAPDVVGGTQATGHVTLSGGSVVGIVIDVAGSGYTKTPTGVLAGDGTGATIAQILLVATTVASLTVRATGSLYQDPSLTIVDATTGATATGMVLVSATSVAQIFIFSAGSGYSSPTIEITGGGGAGAAGTIGVVSGTITSVAITAAGTGYTGAPTLTEPSGGGTGATVLAAIGFLTYVDVDEVTTCKDLVQRTTIDPATIPAQIAYPISMRVDHKDLITDSLVILSTNTGGTTAGLNENGTIGGSGPALMFDYVDYMTDSQLVAYAAAVQGQFSVTGRKLIATLVYETIQPSGAPFIYTARLTAKNQGTTTGIMDLTYEVKPFGVNKVHTIKYLGSTL